MDTLEIPVSDLDRASDWYVARAGFSTGGNRPVTGSDGRRRLQMVDSDGDLSYALVAGDPAKQPGRWQFTQTRTDVAHRREELVKRGVAASPLEAGAFGSSFTFDDPDGNTWVIQSADQNAAAAAAVPTPEGADNSTAPAGSTAGGFARSLGWFLGAISLLIFGFVLIHGISSGSGTGTGTGTGTGSSWYIHWNCGGSGQCATTMGGQVGVRDTAFTSQPDCEAAYSNNPIQPWNGSGGWWCSQSYSGSDSAP